MITLEYYYHRTPKHRYISQSFNLLHSKGCQDPDVRDMKPGGYSCKDSICINNNIGYPFLKDAWIACGLIRECAKIMKYSNGKYYLRTSDDPSDDSEPFLEHVDYDCNGKIAVIITQK